eukprot:TRINITY_DN1157_c0_g1_i1.p1 TRINITY_DN1157_c0_g1~~TRINITY_DN1157_c0_g1_i1.p1  ORF type:complete len:506 (-),score=66.65 TRINITY_DN1157_c0_g1_i1:23-1540(-)
MAKADVIVIGGGVSGLSSASLLSAAGLEVIVLEAQNRVGGRTFTDSEGTDLGGAYIGPTQNHLLRVIRDLGLEIYKVYTKGRTVQRLRGRIQHYIGTIPPVGLFSKLDLNNVMVKLDEMAQHVPADGPWRAPKATLWDSMTMKDFVHSVCWTRDAIALMETATQALLCRSMSEVSLLYVLWYIRSGGGVRRLFETENGAQDSKLKGGMQQIANGLAARLGDNVRLNSPVASITQSADEVVVRLHDGSTLTSSHVVCAIPPVQLQRLNFTPCLSPMKQQLLQRMPMGSIIKTFVFYETPFWREKQLCGMSVCDEGISLVTFDDTKPDGSMPCIMGFVLAHEATRWARFSAEERRNALCAHYAKVFESPLALKPINYKEQNWSAEPWIGGCYVGSCGPNVLSQFGSAIREPAGRVYFAGTETAKYWAGYIDGAIESGERAARQVLHRLGKISQDKIWQQSPPAPELPEVPLPFSAAERFLPSVTTLVYATAAVVIGIVAVFFARCKP